MADLLWPGDHHAGEILTDAAILEAMIAVEAAWSAALVATGVAPPEAAVTADTLRGLITGADRAQIAVEAESGGNPVIPLVRRLRDGLGSSPAATWLHRGLTSQDVVDTALMICVAEAFAAIAGELDRQVEILARHADDHRATPMVARTLTQQAVPMVFGLKAALWLRGVLDAREQVDALRFPVQLGGAAGTSAAVVELAGATVNPGHLVAETSTIVARELGLEPSTPWHSVRTAITRAGDAAVGCTDAWGHIANDVLTLSRPELGELTEGAGGASSTMPHKANPALSVQIRRAAISAPQLGATLHLAAADAVEERTSGGWHAEWAAIRDLVRRSVVAARQTTRLVDDLRVHTNRMATNLADAGDAVRSEQVSMATIAGHRPEANYLGATTYYIDAQLERARITGAMDRGEAR
ncbi:lyase family protein [Gordonia insulae]|uniref:3-carboxy-cis,cis-muconate cycloisomerase n=1 Tax=Gordonia insulae TaxID=2420509 RepID=A0A3G8JPC3_9ACTN|nr:lyase family protein [Gordonia insulae]AZG46525.1 3-carboxy-cis,cis-muconate cycloisomerase [Gordonia insulae]